MTESRIAEIIIDSFWDILIPGLTVTIPLTAISFAIAMVIAIAVALVQFAGIRGLRQVARFYIWVVRGTPLLVQLFIVFLWPAKCRYTPGSSSCGHHSIFHK